MANIKEQSDKRKDGWTDCCTDNLVLIQLSTGILKKLIKYVIQQNHYYHQWAPSYNHLRYKSRVQKFITYSECSNHLPQGVQGGPVLLRLLNSCELLIHGCLFGQTYNNQSEMLISFINRCTQDSNTAHE